MYQPGGDSIGGLILRRGDVQAAGSMRQGDIWGGTLRDLGGIIGQALQQRNEQQAQAKADAAVSEILQGWDGQDAKQLNAALLPHLGPKGAMEYTQGMVSFRDLEGKADDANIKRAQGVAGLLATMTPEQFAQYYPLARTKLAPIASQLGQELPEQPTAELQQWLGTTAGQKIEAPKLEKLVTKNADGSETVRWVRPQEGQAFTSAAEPEKPQSLDQQLAAAYAAGDQPKIDSILALKGREAAATRPPKGAEKDADVEGFLVGLKAGDYGMERVPPTLVNRVTSEAKKLGIDTRTTKQKDIDAAAESTLISLRQLEDQAKRTITAESGPGAKAQGALQRAGTYVGLAEQTQRWDSQVAKLAMFARQLGERGVLTDRDVERVAELLPKLTDKTSLRDSKLKDIREIIEGGLRGKVSERVKFPTASAGQEAGTSVAAAPLPTETTSALDRLFGGSQ